MDAHNPKYLTLADWLREEISGGRISRGSRIPSENALVKRFSLSRQTVRQAIGLLESEGLVERRRGSGTYVRPSPQKLPPAPGRTAGGELIVGVLSTYVDDYIFPGIISGIEQVLSARGCALQIAFTHNRVENETRALNTFLDGRVDGVIAEPTKSALPCPNLGLYRALAQRGAPVVFFNAGYPGQPWPAVALDDTAAGRLATEHLLGAGHRHIAGLFQSDDIQGHLRYAGYLQALQGAGLSPDSEAVVWFATEDISGLDRDPARLLGRLSGCTAAVCYNDKIAVRLAATLSAAEFSLPRDFSLVSIDDSSLAAVCDPPLTSVKHPKEQLGRAVAETLLALAAGRHCDGRLFTPQLARRGSVAPPGRGL